VTGNRSLLRGIPSRVSDLDVYKCPISFPFCSAAFVERKLIPVGPAYLAHVRRAVHDLSFEEHDKHVEEEQKRRRNLDQLADEDDLGVGDEKETEDILLLDPKEWKVSRMLYLCCCDTTSCPVFFRNKTIMLSLGYRILDIELLRSRLKSLVCNAPRTLFRPLTLFARPRSQKGVEAPP